MSDTPYKMRAPCKRCSGTEGRIETRSGQDCVICNCGAYQYCAPKAETGRAVRSVSTVHKAIKPNQRARVLLRSSSHCELCGRSGGTLHVGHLLSVSDGMDQGLTEIELNDDDNLAAMCEECNLGLGDETVPLRLVLAITLARAKNRVKDDSKQLLLHE